MGSHRIELACETALEASRVCPPGFLSGWKRLERVLTALAMSARDATWVNSRTPKSSPLVRGPSGSPGSGRSQVERPEP
eukprot:874795-Alexandrium_andersonii.AAC.1